MKPFIQLNQEEIMQGSYAGLIRANNAIKRGDYKKGTNSFVHHSGDPNKCWQDACEGALAEMAVAKYYELFWSSGDRTGLDINNELEVRQTPHKNGRLIIRPVDIYKLGKADTLFILCCGRHGAYTIAGYLQGCDGMRDEWFTDPTNSGRDKAWFVPQKYLIPIE